MQQVRNQVFYTQKINFSAATKPEDKKAPQQEQKSHDGAMILGILGATAATVGIIAYIKKGKGSKELENATDKTSTKVENVVSGATQTVKKMVGRLELQKLEKQVFEPLKGFKGSNEAFTHKAYGLLVKAHGIEDVAPRLSIIDKNDMGQGALNFAEGLINLKPSVLKEMTQGDILGLLSHEVEHLCHFGDVARVMGVDEFGKCVKEITPKKIETCIQEEVAPLRKMTREEMLEALLDDEKGVEMMGQWFPEGLDNITNDQILGVLEKNMREIGQNNSQNMVFNHDFWSVYVNKKGRATAEQVGNNVENLVAALREGNTGEPAEFNGSNYFYYKQCQKYHSNPFEKMAFDVQYKTQKSWEDYLGGQKISFPKGANGDVRPVLDKFSQIDASLTEKYPQIDIRDKAFGVLLSHASHVQKTEDIATLFDVINKGLKTPDSSYSKIITLFSQCDEILKPQIHSSKQRVYGLQVAIDGFVDKEKTLDMELVLTKMVQEAKKES